MSEVGTTESPSGSNSVKYNTEYYGREVSGSAYPWCCVFIWWLFRHCGASELFYGGERTASCTTLMNYHKKLGQTVTTGFMPGDILLLNFSGAKYEATHVGLVLKTNSDGSVQTIEGNTSVTSDNNGGAVMVRTRSPAVIVCAVRPGYASENNDGERIESEMTDETITSIAGTGDTHAAWANEAINAMVSAGIINGDGNGNYGWEKPLTRQAAAQIIYNLLKKLELTERLE